MNKRTMKYIIQECDNKQLEIIRSFEKNELLVVPKDHKDSLFLHQLGVLHEHSYNADKIVYALSGDGKEILQMLIEEEVNGHD